MINLENTKTINDSVFSAVEPSEIYIFGSYAKNAETSDSDIDICVVTNEKVNPLDVMTKIRLSLFDKLNKPLDIVVYNKNDFETRKNMVNTFEEEIASTGVKIYG